VKKENPEKEKKKMREKNKIIKKGKGKLKL
jgi:hypothetical protein